MSVKYVGELEQFVQEHMPAAREISQSEAVRIAGELSLTVVELPGGAVEIRNYQIPRLGVVPLHFSKELVKERMDNRLPFDSYHYTKVEVSSFGLRLIPLVRLQPGDEYLRFDILDTGWRNSRCVFNPAKHFRVPELVEYLFTAWAGFEPVSMDRDVVEIWLDRSRLPETKSGDCGPIGQVEMMCFVSDIPGEVPLVSLSHLGLGWR